MSCFIFVAQTSACSTRFCSGFCPSFELKPRPSMPRTRPAHTSHLTSGETITTPLDSWSAIQPAKYALQQGSFQARGRTIYNHGAQASISQSAGCQRCQSSSIGDREDSYLVKCDFQGRHDAQMRTLRQGKYEAAGSPEEDLITSPEDVSPSAVLHLLTQSGNILVREKIDPGLGRLSDEEAAKVADELFHTYIDRTVFCTN